VRCLLVTLLFSVACGGSVASQSSSGSTGQAAAATSSSTSGGSTGGTSGTGSTTTTSGGTSTTASSSSSGTTTGAFMTAAHHALPQVPNNGIPTIAHPALVMVTYAGYTYDVRRYATELVGSSWLATVGQDYGVGLGQIVGGTVLDGGPYGGPVAVTDSDVANLLTTLIVDGGIPVPTPDTIYFVTYPESTTISAPWGSSCSQFGGYHNYFVLDGGTAVVFSVLPTCSAAPGSLRTTEDLLDEAFSHELIEAATDPTPALPKTGYAIIDVHDPWTYSFGEVGDLCFVAPPYQSPDFTLTATRVWSNTAAKTGTGSPCIPAMPDEVYFNVSVDSSATVIVDAGSQDQTVTFNLTGWSTAPMADWQLFAVPNGDGTFYPSVLVNGNYYPININNGAVATLTVTIPGGTGSGNFAGVALYSYVSSGASQVDFFGSFAMAAVYVQ
jgi:hypothetical protein